MSGSNPKFLNVESKVQYNMRVPKRLIDKYTAYAELNGNTTTNVIINVLSDFIADKVLLNDYLENTGGVAVKIPYAINQKISFICNEWNLKDYSASGSIQYYIADTVSQETYFAELFEIKKIPNNLDIYNGDSYIANKNSLQFNQNAIHSGIELFIYNIAETIFADSLSADEFDSFLNCLYCLYFEVDENENIDVYLINYLSAINLLSASGNDSYKDLIIAAASELENVDQLIYNYDDELTERKSNLKFDNEEDYIMNHDFAVEKIEKELYAQYLKDIKNEISAIADKYNSNNIIEFGSDILNRIAIKDVNVTPDIDDVINEKINDALDRIFDERIGKIEKINENCIDKIDHAHDEIKDIMEKLDKLNEIINK